MHQSLTGTEEVKRRFLTVAGEVMHQFLTAMEGGDASVQVAMHRFLIGVTGEVIRRVALWCVCSLLRCEVVTLKMVPRGNASRTVTMHQFLAATGEVMCRVATQ